MVARATAPDNEMGSMSGWSDPCGWTSNLVLPMMNLGACSTVQLQDTPTPEAVLPPSEASVDLVDSLIRLSLLAAMASTVIGPLIKRLAEMRGNLTRTALSKLRTRMGWSLTRQERRIVRLSCVPLERGIEREVLSRFSVVRSPNPMR